ncbi:MAG: DUF4150 domain-containing protein [Pirellulaceae bacterium]|nr:DUF4150 domain-containing protein [Pirellulaceae bacterium]
MALKEGTRQDSQFIVMSICPDVCKSPTVPVPYPIVGFLDKSIFISPNVRSLGKPVFHMGSRVATVMGDEAGVGGGVASQVIKGFCKPIVPITTVRINGQFANHNDICYMLMNGASPEGPFNTIGQVLFLGPMFFADVGPGGTIPPGTNPPIQANSIVEGGCLPDMSGMPGGGFGDLGEVIDIAKQAYALATTDWRNPASVLGAIGGVAGLANFGQLAQAAQLAQTGYSLATADWSNPGAAMGAVMGIAGPMLAGATRGVSDGESLSTTGSAKNFPPGIVCY